MKLFHNEMPLDEFRIKIKNKYLCIGQNTLVILLQLSKSYLCGTGLSVLTSKKRGRLHVAEEMRVALPNVPPDIERTCARNQAQISV